ncbi:MAG: enoyl-CoA hydratase [Promethearchaeota archaeon]
MSEQIITKFENKVLHIILNRPEKKNALTRAMYGRLASALEQADNDPNIRVMLLYGRGDSFCAGNDIKDFQDISSPENSYQQKNQEYEDRTKSYINLLINAKKPIIAAVHGFAIGVGVTMLFHFDLIYGAKNTKFQLPFVNLGLIPEFGSTYLLPKLVGYHRAAEIFFFGEFFTAEEAHQIGLVNKIFPEDHLIKEATSLAEKLAEKPPESIYLTKSFLKRHTTEISEKTAREEIKIFRRRLMSPEAVEAFSAFYKHRKPDFSK